MEHAFHCFPMLLCSVLGGFYLLFLGLVLSGIWRGIRSQTSWQRAPGRIQSFGVSHGVPSVAYEYEIDGHCFSGTAFVPGAIPRKSVGVALPKAAYLDKEGRLKFEPGAAVDVFYNPQDPRDAALIPGVQRGAWIMVGVMLLIPVLGFLGWMYGETLTAFLKIVFQNKLNERHAVGIFLCLGSLLPLFFGISYWRRARAVRRFQTTPGRLLSATVQYHAGGESGDAYFPCVSYEYEVDGRCYQSSQWSSLPLFHMGSSRKKAQAWLDALLAEPELIVYYDPAAPWDAFLRPGPVGLAIGCTVGTVLLIWGLIAYFSF